MCIFKYHQSYSLFFQKYPYNKKENLYTGHLINKNFISIKSKPESSLSHILLKTQEHQVNY